jgi:uncharacterized protein YukE
MSLITYANTTEIDNIADELLALSQEYQSEIDKLFSRLSDVPEYTKEWQGTQAKKFFNAIGKNKREFDNVGSQMKYIANKIKADAIDISSTISKCNSNEAKRDY